MTFENYSPEDHELAKALYAAKGPLGLIAARGLSGQFEASVPRTGGYLAYLPLARRRRLAREK